MKKIQRSEIAESKYGWLIIALGVFTVAFAVCVPLMCMPVLFNEISKELDLSLAEIGAVWGITGLASMIMTTFGGLLGDRFGTKRTIIINCILVGIAGAMRAFSTGFISLLLTMFLFGLLYNTIVLNVHKCSSIWFSGKNVVIANGIISTSVAIGFMLGAGISDTMMSPLLGGWKNVMILYGAISAATGLLWIFTRSAPVAHKQNVTNSPAFSESLSIVLRAKTIWLKAIVQFCYVGSFVALVGYLSLYLRGIGWTPVAADSALAALNGAGMFLAIPLAVLSSRVKSKKTLISVLLGIALLSMALIPLFSGIMIWALVIIFGLIRDGFFAIMITMIMETEGIGVKYAGTATGIVISSGNLGTFTSSTIGNSLANINPNLAFVFWAALIGIALILNLWKKK